MTPADIERADDGDLVEAVGRGNQAAFAALFRRRRGDVYRFALHMTGSTAAADDVTQEVFLALMRIRPATTAGTRDGGSLVVRHRSQSRPASGLEGAAARLVVSGVRRIATALASPGPEVETDPVSDLARIERVEAVRRAVLRLPFKYREVIVLCDLQEMSYADAAAGLGCAVGTVRSRLHRGARSWPRSSPRSRVERRPGRPTRPIVCVRSTKDMDTQQPELDLLERLRELADAAQDAEPSARTWRHACSRHLRTRNARRFLGGRFGGCPPSRRRHCWRRSSRCWRCRRGAPTARPVATTEAASMRGSRHSTDSSRFRVQLRCRSSRAPASSGTNCQWERCRATASTSFRTQRGARLKRIC